MARSKTKELPWVAVELDAPPGVLAKIHTASEEEADRVAELMRSHGSDTMVYEIGCFPEFDEDGNLS